MTARVSTKSFSRFLWNEVIVSRSRRRVWLNRSFARLAATVIVGLLVANWNPVNIVSYTSQMSTRVLNHITSLFLSNRWRDDIAVVLIDDHYINTHSSWPMTYVEHARNLRKILSYEPRAVFVDMLFTRDKDPAGIFPLILTLKEYERKGIKVFVPESDTRAGMLEQIGRLVTPVSTHLPLSIHPDHEYPLNRGMNPSPALALFRAFCDDPRRERDRDVCDRPASAGPVAMAPKNMLLVWGTSHSALNEKTFRCPEQVSRAWIETVIHLVTLKWLESRGECPRYPTLLIENLLGGFSDDQNGKYLKDNIVIYAPDIDGASMKITTPTSWPMAVSLTYSHAAALENLLEFREDYFAHDVKYAGISMSLVINLSTFFVVSLLISLSSLQADRFLTINKHNIKTGLAIDASSLGFAFLVLSLISLVMVLTFRMAPANIVGIAVLITGIREARDWRYYRVLEVAILKWIRRDPRPSQP